MQEIDCSKILEITANDKVAAQRLINMFVEELDKTLSEIEQLEEQENYSEMGKILHRMNGAAGYFGVSVLRAKLQHIEQSIKRGDIALAKQDLPLFYEEAQRILTNPPKIL